ncbi:hypothetical protein PG999_000565 [Apiospora kogelbergensis]|uniref:Uncharacterized protein n=1 Tax=Apiospora kogelbergensis TaxID=1337665 RepID=A0AAW0RBU2_9PEZI
MRTNYLGSVSLAATTGIQERDAVPAAQAAGICAPAFNQADSDGVDHSPDASSHTAVSRMSGGIYHMTVKALPSSEALVLNLLALLLVLGLLEVGAAGAGALGLALVGFLGGFAHLVAVLVVLGSGGCLRGAWGVAGLAVAGEEELDGAAGEVVVGSRGAVLLGSASYEGISIDLGGRGGGDQSGSGKEEEGDELRSELHRDCGGG